MSLNSIPRVQDPLIVLARNARSGVEAIGAVVGLKQNDLPAVEADLLAVTGEAPAEPTDSPIPGTRSLYHAAVSASIAANRLEHEAMAAARAFCAVAIDVLRPTLGRQWNSDWVEAGFGRGSLAVSKANPETILIQLRAYFGAHPDRMIAALGVTLEGIEQQLDALSQTRQNADARLAARVRAKEVRDDSLARLRQRMIGLRQELNQLLDADDERWYQFGFSRPSDGRKPNKVPAVEARANEAGEVRVSWQRAPLAENYRVTWQVAEPEATEVQAGLFADLATTLKGLPAEKQIIVRVSARNRTGESAPVTITAIVQPHALIEPRNDLPNSLSLHLADESAQNNHASFVGSP